MKKKRFSKNSLILANHGEVSVSMTLIGFSSYMKAKEDYQRKNPWVKKAYTAKYSQ